MPFKFILSSGLSEALSTFSGIEFIWIDKSCRFSTITILNNFFFLGSILETTHNLLSFTFTILKIFIFTFTILNNFFFLGTILEATHNLLGISFTLLKIFLFILCIL